MKVACIQPQIFQNRTKCYLEVEKILKKLLDKDKGNEIVCLPERWVPYSKKLNSNLQEERGEDYNFVRKLAKNYNINIISGAIWERRSNSEKPAITCYYFDENGEEIGRQDKIHLYSYEREQFESGKELILFKVGKSYHFAILICFDMAFFETPRAAVENGADLLFSPTQIREDGMFNWDIYLKARTLENRVPVVASNTYGSYLRRRFLGKSKILSFVKGNISPSKLKIIEAPSNSSGFIFDNIDLDFPQKLRSIRLNEKIEKEKILVRKK
jgi:nitrilase